MEEKQTNYTIWEGYELPSGGLIYNKPVNPHIELRAWTSRDEMKRQCVSTLQFKKLCDLIDAALIEKIGISSYDLALPDYEYLLHKARVVSYGPLYKMDIICPEETCGERIKLEANLDELKVVTLTEETAKQFLDGYTVVLPDGGNTVTLKFKTPRILDEISSKVKALMLKTKNAEVEFTPFVTLQCAIDTVDGNKLDSVRLETFINKLTAKDMIKLLNAFDMPTVDFGLDTTIETICPECGGEVITFFRYGSEFFRPTNI